MMRFAAGVILGVLVSLTVVGVGQNWDVPREGQRITERVQSRGLRDEPMVQPDFGSRYGFGEAPVWTEKQQITLTQYGAAIQDRSDRRDEDLKAMIQFLWEEHVRLVRHVNERNALQDEAIRDTSRHWPVD